MSIRKLLAFLKRDIIISTSYRLSFIMTLIGIVSSTLTFFFISKLFKRPDYFPFVLIGIAFSTYLYTALNTFSGNLRGAQATGTLEAMLVTPTKIEEIVIGMSLWDFLFASIRVLAYLLLGVIFFGVSLKNTNILAAGIIFILSILCFASIGIASAGFILIFKRVEPITWVMATFTGLVSGTYFPIEILPNYIRTISYFIPVTYSLRGLRGAILNGYSIVQIFPDILALCGFFIVLFPLGIFIFRMAIKNVKIDGSLVHY